MLGSALLISCHEHYSERATFYPVDSLVMAQINYLSSVHATLYKESALNAQLDTSRYSPADSMQWIKELDIFRQLEVINKPINRDSYLVNDGETDPGSNLTIKTFTRKEKEELPVVYLKVYYQHSIRQPRKIEALFDEENALYKSARVLSMDFHPINNKTVLTSYSITGGQKMILRDSVDFSIRGKITVGGRLN